MSFINDQPGFKSIRDAREFAQGGGVAIHAEQAIGDNPTSEMKNMYGKVKRSISTVRSKRAPSSWKPGANT
jgi:hypothetical protein